MAGLSKHSVTHTLIQPEKAQLLQDLRTQTINPIEFKNKMERLHTDNDTTQYAPLVYSKFLTYWGFSKSLSSIL